MPMVHDTEIDAVNSTFASAAVAAVQTVFFWTNQNKRVKMQAEGGERTKEKRMTRSQIQMDEILVVKTNEYAI